MFTCSEIRIISLNRKTRVQLHSYLLSSSYKEQIWQFRRHACLLTSCWFVYCAFKQIQALLKIQEKWHMHSFFKQANCLHNHNTQVHNLGIWYLEWVWDEELFLLVLFYTPSQANRACPDVINWSISANNTAQTYHYTKSFFILLFKARFKIFKLRFKTEPTTVAVIQNSWWCAEWYFLSCDGLLDGGVKKWFIAQHVETLTKVKKSYYHMEAESLAKQFVLKFSWYQYLFVFSYKIVVSFWPYVCAMKERLGHIWNCVERLCWQGTKVQTQGSISDDNSFSVAKLL